jgi:hypothetical protein
MVCVQSLTSATIGIVLHLAGRQVTLLVVSPAGLPTPPYVQLPPSVVHADWHLVQLHRKRTKLEFTTRLRPAAEKLHNDAVSTAS